MSMVVRTAAGNRGVLSLKDELATEQRSGRGSIHGLEARCEPRPSSERIMLTLVVEESEWGRARGTIMRSGGHDIELLRVAPLAGGSRLRIHIGLESAALGATMRRIMRSLTAAEFGPAVPVQWPTSLDRPAVTSQ